MDTFYVALAIFLVLNVAASLIRVIRGPTAADRLMTAQLFGTTGVALLLLLAEASGQPAFRNVALIFALLAILIVICFVQTTGSAAGPGNREA